MWKNWNLHYWQECEMVQSLWKTVRRFIQKLKIELPFYPEISLSECLSKRVEYKNFKSYLDSKVYCRTIHNSREVETTHMSTNRRTGRENVVET